MISFFFSFFFSFQVLAARLPERHDHVWHRCKLPCDTDRTGPRNGQR